MAEVPKQAYTMGIRNIMAARKILLVATGISKAEALYNSLYGPITPKVPASVLQLHPDLTVVADEDALSMIRAKNENKNPEYNCRIKKDGFRFLPVQERRAIHFSFLLLSGFLHRQFSVRLLFRCNSI